MATLITLIMDERNCGHIEDLPRVEEVKKGKEG
jgi:hypothetical protein